MPKFEIERAITIEASPASVFSNVKDFRNWTIWSPWILAEPDCQLEYAPDGKSYSWEGKIIGSGKMELLSEEENRAIHYRLDFFKPWKSTSSVSFYFEESSGKTTTKWTMSGALPFFLFWMKKTMVAAISMDYDRGLRMLKDHVEKGEVPSKLEFLGVTSIESFDYIAVKNSCNIVDISKTLGDDMKRIASALKESGVETQGAPVCFYDKFEVSKGRTSYTVALPVDSAAACPAGFEKGSLPKLQVYGVRHTGPYRHLANAWGAGMMHSQAKVFPPSKAYPPFEVYENDPCEVSEDEIVATVYLPAK